jgi:hypothetical protein
MQVGSAVPEDDRAARWRVLTKRAAEQHGELIERALRDVAARAWGRGWLRPSWRIVAAADGAAWRAYRYLGSGGEADHHYLELGVVCHLDPAGNLVGYGVDNGVDFIGLHDTSEYGLRRGLEFIRQQRDQVRVYPEPRYDHKIRDLAREP